MERKHIDGATVTLIPAYDGALQLGVGPSADGKLQAQLTVDAGGLGNFRVLLSAQDLAVLAAVSRTLLKLTAEQARALLEQLGHPQERKETDDE